MSSKEFGLTVATGVSALLSYAITGRVISAMADPKKRAAIKSGLVTIRGALVDSKES